MTNNYIWDEDNKDIFHKLVLNENSENSENSENGVFIFNENCLELLKNNYRTEYHNIRNNYINKKILWNNKNHKYSFGIVNNCIVDSNGLCIIKKKVYVNGGCKCDNKTLVLNNNNNIKKYDIVISITAKWCDSIWHFPFESFVALKSISHDILKQAKIHVGKKTSYILQWLKLLDIESSQVVSGCVYGNIVYFPKMGDCGNPYYDQILWIKDIITKNLINSEDFKYVILIKRNVSRTIFNFEDFKKVIQEFANTKKLELYIHDDACLPTLVEQHKIFRAAKYVFAPHGAGGIHLPALKKSAWYIEFFNEDINVCYAKLAYLLKINYWGLDLNNGIIDIVKLNNLLLELK